MIIELLNILFFFNNLNFIIYIFKKLGKQKNFKHFSKIGKKN
jgi:hypothetical protein